jgi:chaperonin GroES
LNERTRNLKLKKLDFDTITTSENLAEEFKGEELKYIGQTVAEWYDIDKRSRSGWEHKYDEALKLALQISEEKTYPWPKAANVKFPLLTIASLQFSARVYPSLIKPPDIVKVRRNGMDPAGKKASRANRVSKYMSYQLLEENEDWEEQQDKLFIILPILGCAFKKTYYDQVKSKVCSKLVLPNDLVVNYWAKSIEEAERKTEKFLLFPRQIKERQLKEIYLDIDLEAPSEPEGQSVADRRQGTEKPAQDSDKAEDSPRTILECHCYWDLDGDGYKEPYIVTIDESTQKVLRIVNRFGETTTEQSEEIKKLKTQNLILAQTVAKEIPPNTPVLQQQQLLAEMQKVEAVIMKNDKKIKALAEEDPKVLSIEPMEYYTKYSFIPAPDGGFYDLGFGQLLSPLNESVNALINQLIDSGTLQNSSSGFLGRGARLEGGKVRFQPFEWKYVNVPGGDLKSSIVPLPVNAPSPVVFSLLQMLISYAERVSSVTEVMQGADVGQNTPAFNMASMLEQGLQVFNGVFKRVYRSFRSEIRKIYRLDAKYLDITQYIETMDGPLEVLRSDFTADDKDVIPAADPNAFSYMEDMMKAQFLAQRSAMAPGYNPIAVEKRLLEAAEVQDVDEVYPLTPEGEWAFPPPPNPELELEKAEEQRKVMESQTKQQVEIAKAESELTLNEIKGELMKAQAEGVEDKTVIDRANILLEKQRLAHEKQLAAMEMRMKQIELMQKQQEFETKKVELQVKKEEAKKPKSDGMSSKSK